MITNIDQLKKLIEWARDKKLKKLKMGDIEFEISELDFIPEEKSTLDFEKPNLGEYNTDTLVDTAEEAKSYKDDPDLFWSSNS